MNIILLKMAIRLTNRSQFCAEWQENGSADERHESHVIGQNTFGMSVFPASLSGSCPTAPGPFLNVCWSHQQCPLLTRKAANTQVGGICSIMPGIEASVTGRAGFDANGIESLLRFVLVSSFWMLAYPRSVV